MWHGFLKLSSGLTRRLRHGAAETPDMHRDAIAPLPEAAWLAANGFQCLLLIIK
jgi:hypothetical protein